MDDQERNLLSNPLFHQKDLLAPTTIEPTLQAVGKVVHLGDGPTIPLRVRLGILLARGGILLHVRRLGFSDDSSADGRFTAAAAGPSVSGRRP